MKRPRAMSERLKAAIVKTRQEADVVVDERETASENERIACMIILACGNDGTQEQQTYAWAARHLAQRLPKLVAQLDAANELLVFADEMWNTHGGTRALHAYKAACIGHSRAQLKETK